MNYTYKINGMPVSPEGDWSISNERNEGQIFFRRKFSGELTFRGADYQTIMGMSDCDILEFVVYCGVNEFWTGQFKFPYDFTIDTDSCFLKGEPEVVDEYSCIMANYDTEYQITIGGTSSTPDLDVCGGGNLDTLPTGYTIYEYLNRLINAQGLDCSLTLKSSFMWRDNFPNGDNYAAAYGTNNYITGALNRLEYIYIFKNSELRIHYGGTGGCDPAWKTNFHNFKEWETFLRQAFNAYWYIDQNGNFRIEHIHFFDSDFAYSDFTVGINLKELISNNGHSYAYRRNKYSYETSKLYDQEVWKWQHYADVEGTVTHGTDFEGTPILYLPRTGNKCDCVPGDFKERELTTPRFWSDIYWAYQLQAAGTPDTIDCPGWCFIDVDISGAPDVVRCEVGDISAGNVINGHCSTANLLEHYHLYDRVLLNGVVNNDVTVNILTAQRIKLQEAIEFERCCSTDFDALDYVRTEMGIGRVKAATEKKRSIEIELLY